MKTMQSFDYSPSSKKQPKMRYYHPMMKIKSHKKKISSRGIYSSITWLLISYPRYNKQRSFPPTHDSLFTEFLQLLIPIPNYFTIKKKVKELWAHLYLISLSLHKSSLTCYSNVNRFCEDFFASKISL